MCYSICSYLVLILFCTTFCVFLILSGIHVIMTWLCTIETYIWTFLYTNVFLSVSTVYILSSVCLPYVCLFVTDMDPCGLKQINWIELNWVICNKITVIWKLVIFSATQSWLLQNKVTNSYRKWDIPVSKQMKMWAFLHEFWYNNNNNSGDAISGCKSVTRFPPCVPASLHICDVCSYNFFYWTIKPTLLPPPGGIAILRVCWFRDMCWDRISLKRFLIETRLQWNTCRKWRMRIEWSRDRWRHMIRCGRHCARLSEVSF